MTRVDGMGEGMMLQQSRSNAWEYIRESFRQYGHFPLFDYYPNYEPRKAKGWHYNYESPFIHASVMDSLLNAGVSKRDDLMLKAAEYLLDFREPGDLWRFWKIGQAEHPIFCDVDETSICSFALRKMGYKLNNQRILYSRIRKDGAVPTWIEADMKLFFINPVTWCWLKYQDRAAMPTIKQWGWVTFDDAEVTVAPNVLAYLGLNDRTRPVLDYIIREWHAGKVEELQYYDRWVVVAFHIARAYKEGIKELAMLSDSVTAFIEGNLSDFSFPELLMAYLSASYLKGQHPVLEVIKRMIMREIYTREAFKEHYPYTTEKLRLYYGGSGVLTAAWFLEATKDWT